MGVYQWVKQSLARLTSATPVSGHYNGGKGDPSTFFNVGERPPFSIFQIEQMELDPKVCIALGIRNGLLMQSEVIIEGGPPRIRDWVESEWQKIWLAMAARILETKNFGFQAFELMLKKDQDKFPGKFTFESYRDFHPRDVLPLVNNGKVIGATINNVLANDASGRAVVSKVPIFNPKGIWLTYNSRYGTFFGRSLLRGAYPPWTEKWQRGGAIKLRQLRMMKDAWIGDQIKYPTKQKTTTPDGKEVSWKDVAREWVECRYSGGVGGLPSECDPISGKPLWEYIPPQNIDGASQLFEYKDELDEEILDALETPAEVIQAVKDGGLGGPGGRSIPFVALCAILQDEFSEYLSQINEQYLKVGVRNNFNTEPTYTIRAKSLIKTLSGIMGGDQKPQEGFQGGGPVAGNFPQLLQRQKMQQDQTPPATANQNLALSENFSPRVIQRIEPRKTGRYGATVGGVYYRPGEWVDGLALRFASDEEVLQLSENQFEESKHPRGQTENAGEFASKSGAKAGSGNPDMPKSNITQIAKDVRAGKISRNSLRKQHGEEVYFAVKKYLDDERVGEASREYVPTEEDKAAETKAEEAAAREQEEQNLRDEQEHERLTKKRAVSEQDERDRHSEPHVRKKLSQQAKQSADELKNHPPNDRESRRLLQADVQMPEAHVEILKAGWEFEYMSGSGSIYYRKGEEKLRLADHEVPMSAERSHNSNSGGFTWADGGSQILLPVGDLAEEIKEATKAEGLPDDEIGKAIDKK